MTFRVGQKVVCIKTGRCPYGETPPTLNAIYTVRDITEHPKGTGIRLVEIVNPPNDYAAGFFECTFAASCFRPLVERQTDISALKALLVPGAKIRETA
jgi:hypothetical protein